MTITIAAYASHSALGRTNDTIASALSTAHAPGMQEQAGYLISGQSLMLGTVLGELPAIPEHLSAHNSRNNALLLSTLHEIAAQVQAVLAQVGPERFGIVMGTSTSGLDEADHKVSGQDQGQWQYPMQELGDPARFLQRYLKTTGPAYTISTACSSSARALISACRMLTSGMCAAVLCGGADTLCRMPINGFNALELVSDELCAPFAQERKGITIGEGAGLMLLTTDQNTPRTSKLSVVGYGESSDAYHVSAPEPEGKG
ncbi:MAG TPA: beta-ketoacyl-ACP synthase, partial [Candidatus Anaerobiospirillum stercoravium]|nr:beta-ketoacyl-ACP synthase [Candidatus Anaerobiospirillum stercoravium]